MNYVMSFLVGGALCLVGQLLIERTRLTPARILVGYVVAGVVLSAFGVYETLLEYGHSGASVPLTGFGHLLADGVRTAVREKGFVGILTGGLTSSAGGVAAAIVFSLLASLLFRPRMK
ncbi:MAG: stage V sporulation protein AE [Clostridia bacterium]|nr:stage V sporulation protein AE [Clostridia bacterium]